MFKGDRFYFTLKVPCWRNLHFSMLTKNSLKTKTSV